MAVRSFEALGFDPAPGDLALTGDAVRTLRAVVDAMTEVEGVLAGAGDGQWVGQTADAFRATVADELTPRVKQALSSFSEATNAMRQWMGQLESFQARAQRLEEQARRASDDVRAAQANLDALPSADHLPERQADEAQQDRGRAQGRVEGANGELEAILRQARSLRDETEAAAGVTARRIDTSASAAPDAPGVFETIREGLSHIGSKIADVFDWVMEHVVPIIEEALPYIIFALAVASIFTTGGLTAPLLILAGVGIGIDTAQALRGEGSWSNVALGVAGLGAGLGLGRVAGKFMAMRGNAFQIRVNSPGLALPGGGALPGTATASIRFRPDMYNVGSIGWATTKTTDLTQQIPAPLKPQPSLNNRERSR